MADLRRAAITKGLRWLQILEWCMIRPDYRRQQATDYRVRFFIIEPNKPSIYAQYHFDENPMTSESMNWPYQRLAQLLMHENKVKAGALLILKDYAENEVETSNLQILKRSMGLGSKRSAINIVKNQGHYK